ncbi:LiaF transmembrane domain-containing protein [Cohnella soli]|uniref:LiaF transmembrane domain-containing protein n=1 Tax=Cohnella soli TaxID=425005 RepID=A0ABW0HSC5_9BACL
MRSGNGIAIGLIVFGGLMILGKLGSFGLGGLFSLIVPILVVLLGLVAWNNGNRLLGGVLAVIGGIILLGKLSFLFVWIAAIALIVFGVSMINRNNRTSRM